MAGKLQYVVTLPPAERQQLLALLKKGSANARTLRRASVLLLADEGRPDDLMAATVPVSIQTVRNIRKRFAIPGLEAALYEQPRRERPASSVRTRRRSSSPWPVASRPTGARPG
jgi:hypothetical protein